MHFSLEFPKNCNKQFTNLDNNKKCWMCSGCGRSSDVIVKEVVPAENLITIIYSVIVKYELIAQFPIGFNYTFIV